MALLLFINLIEVKSKCQCFCENSSGCTSLVTYNIGMSDFECNIAKELSCCIIISCLRVCFLEIFEDNTMSSSFNVPSVANKVFYPKLDLFTE